MIKVVVLSTIILLACLALLCIRIITEKNGRFPNTHADGNPALQRKGIKCARAQDLEARLRMNLSERLSENN